MSGSLGQRVFAAYYPWLARRSDRAGQGQARAQLLAQAIGVTLEIGAGSGANLPHYPAAVTELTLADPSPFMLDHLRRGLATVSEWPGSGVVSIVEAGFPALPFDDAMFDTIVCTYVLCSVDDVAVALAELERVLVPGGRMLLLEHVRAPEGSTLGALQDAVAIPHRLVADGCRPNRRTERLLHESLLEVVTLEHGSQPSTTPTVRPTITAVARRPLSL